MDKPFADLLVVLPYSQRTLAIKSVRKIQNGNGLHTVPTDSGRGDNDES